MGLTVGTADGRCGVQAVLQEGATSATVEPSVALHAADLIVRTCVRGNPPTGGYAQSVGKSQEVQSIGFSSPVLRRALCATI